MSIRHLLLAPAFLWAATACGQAMPAAAHADFMNAKGEKIGTATLTEKLVNETKSTNLPKLFLRILLMKSRKLKLSWKQELRL